MATKKNPSAKPYVPSAGEMAKMYGPNKGSEKANWENTMSESGYGDSLSYSRNANFRKGVLREAGL